MAKEPEKKNEEAAEKPPVPVHREGRHPLTELRDEMDRLFDSFSMRFPALPSGREMFDWAPLRGFGREFTVAAPRVDVSESDKAYEVVAEIPGMAQKDINLEVKDDVLTLTGEKKEEREEKEKDYHLSERRFGSFKRSFRLPSGVDDAKISASLENGVLKITLPKTAEAQKKAKKIQVKGK